MLLKFLFEGMTQSTKLETDRTYIINQIGFNIELYLVDT